ncbi:MAG: DUF4136 domain-containing protein [Planctomycetota bacterium]|nr:DUF4136 domain-containing protein [Planctomycetota bacterium]
MRWFPVPVLLVAAGCSSISTSYDYDPGTNFSKIRTYQWIKEPAQKGSTSPFVMERIKNAVNRGLQEKGFRPAVDPDILLAAHTGHENRVRITDWGYGYWGRSGTDVYQYEEGTLILDVVHRTSKKLIWRGTAKGVVDPNPTPEDPLEVPSPRQIGEPLANTIHRRSAAAQKRGAETEV